MKLITVVTRQNRLDDVLTALREAGLRGVTVTDVLGSGKQLGRSPYYGDEEYALELQPKVKIEILVTDEACDEICDVIVKAARTGEVGDGKLWIADVDRVLRIRTGETGTEAV